MTPLLQKPEQEQFAERIAGGRDLTEAYLEVYGTGKTQDRTPKQIYNAARQLKRRLRHRIAELTETAAVGVVLDQSRLLYELQQEIEAPNVDRVHVRPLVRKLKMLAYGNDSPPDIQLSAVGVLLRYKELQYKRRSEAMRLAVRLAGPDGRRNQDPETGPRIVSMTFNLGEPAPPSSPLAAPKALEHTPKNSQASANIS
jgi:hypothetical protein